MSLAELLVSLALTGLLFSATLTLLAQTQQAWATGLARAETQQAARVALTRLVADIRAAGFGGAGFAAVAVAEPERVVLQQDIDGDGVIAAGGERVTWRLAGSILRRDAGGGAQPIVNGVRALRLEYLDAAGAPTAIADDVRSVAITLVLEPERPLKGVAPLGVSTLVRLRNR
jgi:type II secretory pathway component PulJ